MVYLFVHGFKRVTNHGETLLLGGSVKKTLSKLDLGYMSTITDKMIKTLTKVGLEIVELCNHNCFVSHTHLLILLQVYTVMGWSKKLLGDYIYTIVWDYLWSDYNG